MPEEVLAGQGWQEEEPAAAAKVPGLQGKHSEVKATPGTGEGSAMGEGVMGPPPSCTLHLPVMPMFLTSTGLGTLDHTEKAVVRQKRTLFPRLSSTWMKRGDGGVSAPMRGGG